MNNRKLHFYIPLAVALVSTTAVVIGLFNYWFGESRGDVMWFCERMRDGFVKQPANTWSNFGFILAGTYIGYISWQDRFRELNTMTQTFFFPIFFACIVVLLGPGSMAMHGSNGPWGGFLDLNSMFMISSFVFFYSLKRLLDLPAWAFAAMFVTSVAVSDWVLLSPYNSMTPYISAAEYIFAGQLIFAFPIELAIRFRYNTQSKMFRGIASALTMCLAFFIWNISRTSESWFCDPDSLIQGHAIWHILNATSAVFLYFYYVSEEDPRFASRL